MPLLHDADTIRRILERDRSWAVYALADLEPAHMCHATWHGAPNDTGVVLIYRAFPTPVLLCVGSWSDLQETLDEACRTFADAAAVYLVVRPDVFAGLQARFEIVHAKRMLRMVLDPTRFPRTTEPQTERLGVANLAELRALYADGEARHEAPEFFLDSMVTDGVFEGVREGGELVAVAGTHVLAPASNVAAIGCIYTRHDRRGFGHATRTTSAVVRELLARQYTTIALNVRDDNSDAISVYQRLGFQSYCDYFEASARTL